MLKILLYGSAEERKILEEALQGPLRENKSSFNIRHLSNPQILVKNYLLTGDYQIIVVCIDGRAAYAIRDKTPGFGVMGILSFPPTPEEISESLIRNRELASFYSTGEYTITHYGHTRKIPYEEIDYIQSNNKKTIMHLANGDTEIIQKGIKKVQLEINRSYFAKCCIGCIVNTRNIYKIHNSSNYSRVIEFKSGAKAIMTSGYFEKFRKAYSMSVAGIADLKALDD